MYLRIHKNKHTLSLLDFLSRGVETEVLSPSFSVRYG